VGNGKRMKRVNSQDLSVTAIPGSGVSIRETMDALFLAFVGLMALVVLGLTARHLGLPKAGATAAGLLVWLLYVGCNRVLGIIRNIATRPPGPVSLFIPVIGLLVFSSCVSDLRRERASPWPFRFGFFWEHNAFESLSNCSFTEFWHSGLIPKMLTFEGANVDIYVGASAPFYCLVGGTSQGGPCAWRSFGISLD